MKKLCSPHQYRTSGRPFRSVVGQKKVRREEWKGNRRLFRTVLQDVLGPLEQRWFCVKCGGETKSSAGPFGPK